MNKATFTNVLALILVVVGYLTEWTVSAYLFWIGLFALSGAVTNSIAIHMLFEKVPFFYGSGVIENRFEEFKRSIASLMMDQFFTREAIDRFFQHHSNDQQSSFDFRPVIDKADFTPAYDSLKNVVMESSFGSMLGMFGGEAALEPLKEPFIKKLSHSLLAITQTDTFQSLLHENLYTTDLSDTIHQKLLDIVHERLNELTPQTVKTIIQQMIKQHLQWLVVWGGFFGGLIGAVSSLII